MVTTTSAQPLLTPAQVESLFVQPMLAQSIAGRVCTVIRTESKWVTIPRMTSGPTASWVEELQEIPTSDASFDSITINLGKLAGLVPVSNEADADSGGEVGQIIGDRLVLDSVRGVDAAFLTQLPAPAPQGLASLPVTGNGAVTVVNGGTNVFTTLDTFVGAVADAEDRQAPITAWIMSPATRTKLATIKAANGSNTYLLTDSDPTRPSYRTIEGIPVYTSAAIPNGTVWGIPGSRAVMVLRNRVEVEVSEHALWSRDGFSIRSKARLGFGFTDPSSLIKITTTAP